MTPQEMLNLGFVAAILGVVILMLYVLCEPRVFWPALFVVVLISAVAAVVASWAECGAVFKTC